VLVLEYLYTVILEIIVRIQISTVTRDFMLVPVLSEVRKQHRQQVQLIKFPQMITLLSVGPSCGKSASAMEASGS
jgi:hypothetical protein